MRVGFHKSSRDERDFPTTTFMQGFGHRKVVVGKSLSSRLFL